ncbi:hypothetical protein O0I10_005576 [Lichtheimia ornata]|uniref:Uncharacterized protein n=1 Tax=Lichtheimia ornata TaxID=688661 RepID=A0AAD7V3V9_9FUNG|nr:uncharacterized protein O0I10_005576 [Lichtheimia ornata]KAJ8658848.1 hypothetical protein O0I10_005576 [Lichtheimia ornata]
MQSLSRLVSRLSVRRKRRESSPAVQETRECQHDSDPTPPIPQQSHRYSAPPQPTAAIATTTRKTDDPAIMADEQQPIAAAEVSSPSSTVNDNQPCAAPQVNIDSLEFSASRDLAQSLGNEWNETSEQSSELIRFPALEHFLTPCSSSPPSPSPPPCSSQQTTCPSSQPLSKPSHRQVTKKPTRSRLSLHRHKSAVQLLKRSKSIPQMVA